MPEQLTRQQELDAKYNSEEQVRARQAKAHDDLIGASIPKAFDLPSSTPIGSEFGLGTKYDVGISKDQLDDRAEYNAQNQTTGDKWKNASVKMLGLAGASAIAGTAGMALGAVDLVTGGEDGEHEFSDLWNNTITNATNDWTQSLEDIQQFPNLQTREEQEMGLGEKLGTANFWADGVMKNAGYAIGMAATGYATGAAISAINSAKVMSSVAEGLVTAGKYSSIDDATIAIANGLETKAVQEGIKLAGKANANKNAIQGYANTTFASLGEASTEALQTKNEVFKRLTLEHPNMTEEEKNAISEKAGNSTMVWNTALLSVTNSRQVGSMISSFDGVKPTLGKIVKDAETGLYKGTSSVAKESAKKIATGIVSEGSEEQLQLLGATTSEDFYTRVANGDDESMLTLTKSLGEGLSKAYGTQEGWENFVTGAVLGFTGIPKVGKYKNGMVGPKLVGGVNQELKDAKEEVEETNNVVSKVNNVIQSDAFKNKYNNTVIASTYEEDKNKSKTEFDFKNAESNQFILDAETFIDAGLYSEFKEQIESLNNTDVNDLRKQFDSKGNYKSYSDEEFKDIVRKETEYKANKLESIRDLKKDINRQFPNASSEYKTQMLQYAAIVDDVEARIEGLTADYNKGSDYQRAVVQAISEARRLESKKELLDSQYKSQINYSGKGGTKEYTEKELSDIESSYNTSLEELGTEITQANASMAKLLKEGSAIELKRATTFDNELKALHARKALFGTKYLEGFGIEFQEKVDTTVDSNRKKREEEIRATTEKAKITKDKTEFENRKSEKYNGTPPVNNSPTVNKDADAQQAVDLLNGDDLDFTPKDYPNKQSEKDAADALSAKVSADIAKRDNAVVTGKSFTQGELVSGEANAAEVSIQKAIDNVFGENIDTVTIVDNTPTIEYTGIILAENYTKISPDNSEYDKVSSEESAPIKVAPKKDPEISSESAKHVYPSDFYDEATGSEIDHTNKNTNLLFEERKIQEDASDSISVYNQEYEESGEYIATKSTKLTSNTNLKMLDPANFPVGTDIRFVVEDLADLQVYYKDSHDIVSWGALRDTLTEEEIALYIPIAIYSGNEKLGYVHTDSFINPSRVVPANVTASKANLSALRKSILAGNTSGSIVEHREGVIKFADRKLYGKVAIRSPKSKLELLDGKLAIAIPTVSGRLVMFVKRDKILSLDSANDIKNTVTQAIAYFFSKGDITKINETYTTDIQKLASNYGYDLKTIKGLQSFLRLYVNPTSFKGGNLENRMYERAAISNVEINYAFNINVNVDGTVDFKTVNKGTKSNSEGIRTSKEVVKTDYTFGKPTVESKDLELQNKFLAELDTILDHTFININNSLFESNKPLLTLTTGGEIKSIDKDYDSFIRSATTTDLEPHIDDSGKEYYFVNPILKFNVKDSSGSVYTNDSIDENDFSDDALSDALNGPMDFDRPFETSTEQVDAIVKEASKFMLLNVSPKFQDDVVESIVGEIGKQFAVNRKTVSISEAGESIFNKLEAFSNALKGVVSDEARITKLKTTKEKIQSRIDNIQAILDNKNLMLRAVDAKMKQSSIFLEDEGDVEESSELDKVEFNKATYSENPIDKISIEVKKLLTGVLAIDKDGKPAKNWFTADVVMDYKRLYKQLLTITTGLEPSINSIITAINAKTEAFPYLKQVVDRIANSEDYIKHQIVKNLTNHENRMQYIQYDNVEYGTIYTVVEANDNGVKQVLLREWDNNLRNSKAFNNETGNADHTYFKELVNEYNSWTTLPEASVLVKWLSKFGITTREDTITRVMSEMQEAGKNPLTDHDSIIFNMVTQANRNSKFERNIDTNNPLKSSPSVIKLAEETAEDSIDISAESFRTGGKTVQAVGTNSYVINAVRELKRYLNLIKDKLTIPFNSSSFWLTELENDEAFRKTFNHFTMALDAFKDKNGKTNRDGEMTKRSIGEIEAIKIANFQALRKKVRTYQETSNGKIVSLYANFLFLTTSDKPTVRGITTKVAPIEIDGKGGITVGTAKFLFDQLVRPELNRMYQANFFKENPDAKQPNSAEYLKACNTFYIVEGLNNADFIWADSAKAILKDGLTDENNPLYLRLLSEYLLPHLRAEIDAKVALWKKVGIGFVEGKEYAFLDDKYMNDIHLDVREGESIESYKERKVRVAAVDMAIQYRVAYANQFQALFTDPANYTKKYNASKTKLQNATAVMDNVAKRLAGAVAPREEMEHPDKNITYLFVADPKSDSYNLEGLRKELSEADAKAYEGQSESDAQEWITLSEKVGNMMANGDIKTSGLGEFIRKTIAKEVKKENYDYLDTLKTAIENKFGEDGLNEFNSFVFQPEKPVYFGTNIDKGTNLENVLYIKSSAMTLYPNRAGALDSLRIIAEKNGVNRIVTASTSVKLGAVKDVLNPWTLDEEGNITGIDPKIIDTDIKTSTATVTRSNWGIQLEKKYDPTSKEIARGSQSSKNFVNGMLAINGFEIDGEIMDGSEVREHFDNIVGTIYKNQQSALLKELEAKTDKDGNILSINIDKIRNILIEEGIEKGYSRMELETFLLDKSLSGIVFAPNAAKIEPLLTSIVTNRVLKIKMHGKGLTLGAETMYVGDLSKSDIVTTDSWEGKLQPSRTVTENLTPSLAVWKSALEKVCD